MDSESLQFLIGEEKTLSQLLHDDEIVSLLRSAVNAGAQCAHLDELASGQQWCWPQNSDGNCARHQCSAPVFIEGEVVGKIQLYCDDEHLLIALVKLMSETVKLLIRSSFQRQLTTEIHTSAIEQSYAELMDSHQRLQQSERKYRELAVSLETTVQQRSAELERTYLQLMQNEKMACVGQLAAGVAHEINTPLGFISSNLNSLKKYLDRLLQMTTLLEQATSQLPTATIKPVHELRSKLKIDFIREDAVDLIDQSLEGAQHVTSIVADLKNFSHVDTVSESTLDINAELDRSLAVLSSLLPENVIVHKAYQSLPEVSAPAAAISQIFYNLLLNAIEAGGPQLQLNLASRLEDECVIIHIQDNGPGVAPAIRSRVFEPFFTTKEVGQGSGMGLALVHQMLQQLGGSIELSSPATGGTLARVRLPMESKHE